jgi:site-specific recombinase XerD
VTQPIPTSTDREDAHGWLPPGLEPEARELIIAAREPSTLRRYERHLVKWEAHCSKRGIDAEKPTPTQVANWLALEAKSRNLGISAVKERRAAVAEFLRVRSVGGGPVATEHQLVVDVARGLNKNKPVKARYEHTVFDVNTLLRGMFTMEPPKDLPNNLLWGKLVAICETCGLRLGDTFQIHPDSVKLDDEKHEVEFTTLLKQTQQLKITPKKIGGSEEDANCVHCAFAELLRRRPANADKRRLFVFPSGKKVSKDWLGKCVRKVMDIARIPAKFKPHSIRHAASSAMLAESGLGETLRVFGWAGPQTFLKHYLGVAVTQPAEGGCPSGRAGDASPEGED